MAKRYVVYEVWTRSRVVDSGRYEDNEPVPILGMSLCNWHIVEVEAKTCDGCQHREKHPTDDRAFWCGHPGVACYRQPVNDNFGCNQWEARGLKIAQV
jgi:hypothetical protein